MAGKDLTHGEKSVPLGPTDVLVSPVGVGTNSWGSRTGPDRDKLATFGTLLEAGISFFDTAEIYTATRSEQTIGRCIRSAGRTPTVLTKFFPFPWRLDRGRLRTALERSLSRLGLSRVDAYIHHWPWGLVPLETWADALADVAQAGLTRAVGVSNYTIDQVRRAHAVLKARGVALSCNEVELSLLRPAVVRDGLLAACRDLGVTVIAYRPLAQGMLSGKYSVEHPPSGLRAAMYPKRRLLAMQPLLATLREIGARQGRSPSQVALNWVMSKGAVPIPGAKDPGQAAENAGAMGWRLSAEEIAELEAAGQSR